MRSNPRTITLGALTSEETMQHGNTVQEHFDVLGVPIAKITPEAAMATVSGWLEKGTSTKLVTFANVHMVTEARRNPAFLETLQAMDMNCPDGMPLVWLGKSRGEPINRVSGPDFMPHFCASPAASGYRHFFYGGAEGVAKKVAQTLKKANPDMEIAGWLSPPFGELSRDEDVQIIESINETNPDIIWVCLGCPKQERWMADHRDQLNAKVMLAVGLAFDVIAGRKARAPMFVQALGMEWLFRMIHEPGRLVKRYLYSNSLFAFSLLSNAVFQRFTLRRVI